MQKKLLVLLAALCLLLPLSQPAMALENETGAAENANEVCCGTDPEFIEELSASLFAKKAEELQGRMKKTRGSMAPEKILRYIGIGHFFKKCF